MVNVIDYMPGDTLLHRLNPVVKLGLAAAIIIGIFLSDTYVALLGFLALTLALGAYAGVVDRLLSLLKLLIPLALIMLVLQLAFMRDGNVVWGFITDTGLITGSKACLRLLGVALPLILMLMVTKLNDLANACVEVLHVLCLHLYHGTALCAGIWPGNERHHGGADCTRRRIRH